MAHLVYTLRVHRRTGAVYAHGRWSDSDTLGIIYGPIAPDRYAHYADYDRAAADAILDRLPYQSLGCFAWALPQAWSPPVARRAGPPPLRRESAAPEPQLIPSRGNAGIDRLIAR